MKPILDVTQLTSQQLDDLEQAIEVEKKNREIARAALPPLDIKEMMLVKQYRIVLAIKEYRNRTGLGLKQSKEAVDGYRDRIKEGCSYGA